MKISGIKKVAGKSKGIVRENGCYLQVNYHKKEKRVWADFHCCLGQNEWTVYHDKEILNCGNIDRPATMKDVMWMVLDAISRDNFQIRTN